MDPMCCLMTFTGFVPAYKVDAVDATAAGDVYCGTLAASLIEGKSMKNAVQYSSAAAALCVTKTWCTTFCSF